MRTVLVEVPNEHPLIWTEQMMPVLPLTRVRNVDEAIDLAVAAEGGYFHTATMHSHDIAALSTMARRCNCSIFVKNGRRPGRPRLRRRGLHLVHHRLARPARG